MDLPEFLRKQLGNRGRTVVPIVLNRRSFEEVKQIILVCARSESLAYEINEDTVKAGIRKYLRRHIDSLEEGMKIIKTEKATTVSNRPDFIAKDIDNRTVIIECKGYAVPQDCGQLERYGEGLQKENPRLILIAFKIDNGCLKEAKNNSRMELIECDLKFKKVFP
jgi:RecB family endonuclease NucS